MFVSSANKQETNVAMNAIAGLFSVQSSEENLLQKNIKNKNK